MSVWVVTETDPWERATWVVGVYSTEQAAQAVVDAARQPVKLLDGRPAPSMRQLDISEHEVRDDATVD